MDLNRYTKQAIVKSIMADVPKPDKTKRHAAVQAAIVKAMSPECRKLYNKTPKALVRQYVGDTTYDGINYHTREVIKGDVPDANIDAILKPYIDEDEAYRKALTQLEAAVNGCRTLGALKKAFPEFEKYLPTEAQPTKNLPALANVVADLSKLGWPKKNSVKEKANA